MNPRKRLFHSTDLFLSNPSTLPPTRRTALLSSVYSSPFTNHSAYQAHHSCVNALAISPGDGKWLASGGDDKRILLHEALSSDDSGTLGEPRAYYQGASSNIFTISFDSTGTKVYSAGNDAAIICHDLETASQTSAETPGGATEAWIDNDDSIHGLSCHPSNPHLFISASSDGTLRQYDTRTNSQAVGLLADAHEMEGVQHHPLQHELFAYAGEDAHAGLVDSRMAWKESSSISGSRSSLQKIARNVAVVNFEANLVRYPQSTTNGQPRTQRARPAVSSLTFSPTGSLLCLTLSGHVPTLYSLSSPSPLATFSAPAPSPPDSTIPIGFPQTYRNACTTKHGSFGGGPNAKEGQGLYYAAGSDDFGVYVWEVPSREKMEEGQRRVDFSEGAWPAGETGTGKKYKDRCPLSRSQLTNAARIGYLSPSTATTPASLVFPHSISEPSSVLRSHRSIANTTLYHPTLPYLYSCGVEKLIIRHSPSPTSRTSAPTPSSSNWTFTPRPPRAEPASFLSSLFGPADPGLETSLRLGETVDQREKRLRKEDIEVLEYFDELIIGESDSEGCWRDAGENEIDGVESSDDESDEEGEGIDEDEDDDERVEAEGDEGTTRRILNSLYSLEEQAGRSSDEEDVEEDGSQASLTVSEEAEYQQLLNAWEDVVE
ncbi:hypothetical protein JCM5353_007144 [Sporobolomyces roseus]